MREQVSKQHHRLPEAVEVTDVRSGDNIRTANVWYSGSLADHLARLGESLSLYLVVMTPGHRALLDPSWSIDYL